MRDDPSLRRPKRRVPKRRKDGELDQRVNNAGFVDKEATRKGDGVVVGFFKPGNQYARLQKGKPRRVSALLQDAVLLAAEAVGADGQGTDGLMGYLTAAAVFERKSFLALLGRIIPKHVQQLPADDDDDKPLSREELRARAIERGLPAHIFDAAIPQSDVEVHDLEQHLDGDAVADADIEEDD